MMPAAWLKRERPTSRRTSASVPTVSREGVSEGVSEGVNKGERVRVGSYKRVKV